MVVHVALVAGTEAERALADAAVAFLDKGDAVAARIVRSVNEVQVGEISVAVCRGAAELTLRDAEGHPWQAGIAATAAVRANTDAIEVRLARTDGVGSSGSVGVLRSVAATVEAGQAVLGPLIARYVTGDQRPGAVASAAAPVAPYGADLRGAVRFAGRLARAAVTTRNWQVAQLPGSIEALVAGRLPSGRVTWQGPTRRAFWADPCVVVDGDEQWLFVEELGKRSGVGLVRACRVVGGRLLAQDVVLQTAHHLSFPQIYRVGQRWLASVETCGAKNPLYTFDRLGDPWRPADDLPALPPHLADAVLTFDDLGHPIHAWGTDATVHPDAVFVRYVNQVGVWCREDASVLVDVRRARGGGTLDQGRGWRSVQDCAGTYGRGASLVDADGRVLVTVTGDDVPQATWRRRRKGLHTLTWSADGTVVWCDGWLRRVTPLGGLWRLRERQHSLTCAG
jgi:hypothetical protein